MIIKVCGMTDDDNMIQVDQLQPEYMGLIFHPLSTRFIGERRLPVTDTPKVGVFVNSRIHDIIEQCNRHHLTHIQLHGDNEFMLAKDLHQEGYTIIKAFKIDHHVDNPLLEKYIPFCKYFLLDTKGKHAGGNGTKFNWDLLNDYQCELPFLLSGGIGPGDSTAIKNITHPFFAGIDINSQFEIEPGLKNTITLKTFIDELR